MKKRILAMLTAGAMLTALIGCGEPAAQTPAPDDSGSASTTQPDTGAADTAADAKGYNISVILKTTAAEYWQYVIAGCEAYTKDHPEIKVDVKGPSSETAYDEQQNMIETDLSNATYDAFVISPLQSDMVAKLIAGQTKPILAVDTNIEAPEILSFVGTGNEEAAKLGGEAAVKAAKEAGWDEIKCIEIAGVQGDATNTARMNGYQAGVEAAGGTFLENEVQYANAVADQAVTCMEAIMQTHPEGIAIICANNDDMAMAAARAAKGNPAYEKTIFLGFNGDKSACDSILKGELTMSVAQQAYEMGYQSVDAAVRALNGETLEEFINSGAEIVDSANAQKRLDTLQSYLG